MTLSDTNKKRLIVVLGPTAVGKTAFSIKISKFLKTEIVSADARQFYKEMSIGTAVPSDEELEEVPHHFIQHRNIEQDYSAGEYQQDGLRILNTLFKKYNNVVLTGGSGLYINALLYGLDTFPNINPKIRQNLNKVFLEKGITPLQEMLSSMDIETYHQIDIHNYKRLIRALEICIGTGKLFSSFKGKKKTARPFKIYKLGLQIERDLLYYRIEQRADKMIKNGLIEEAHRLYHKRHLNALKTVGYKEIFDYFENKISLEKAIEEIKKNSRRYAKRQLTWLKKDKDILWTPYNQERIEELLVNYL